MTLSLCPPFFFFSPIITLCPLRPQWLLPLNFDPLNTFRFALCSPHLGPSVSPQPRQIMLAGSSRCACNAINDVVYVWATIYLLNLQPESLLCGFVALLPP